MIWFEIFLAVWVAGWLCLPHLLLLNKRPTATLAWLWAIIFIPAIGPALYLMIGSERVKRRRSKKRSQFRKQEHWSTARAATAKTSAQMAAEIRLGEEDRTLLDSLARISQLPLATASRLELLRNAEAFYAALKESIRSARREIQIESYVWRDDEVGREFLELLVAAARRGVRVRVLLDEIGSFWLSESHFRPLVEAGGRFSWCRTLYPLRHRFFFNLRNHRKLQIIDARIAYVGGMNFGGEYLGQDPNLGPWADLQIKVEGTVIEILRQIFVEDWFFATGREDRAEIPAPDTPADRKSFVQVLRGGPDEDDYPMLRMNLALHAAAKKRLWIATGYFVPGEAMQFALQVAAARGVDVRLLISERNQHHYLVQAGRSYYNALLRQGIRIYEFHKGVEHSKYIVLDEDWSAVGSCNFDERSMRLNFELSLLSFDRETNATLAGIFLETISQSQEIDRTTFARRSFGEKLVESGLRLLSPLL